jgi:hypothetical protein
VFVPPSASKCGLVSAAFPRSRSHASKSLLKYRYPERSQIRDRDNVYQKLLDRAHGLHLSAIRMLAQVRKMGPAVQSNIAGKLVNAVSFGVTDGARTRDLRSHNLSRGVAEDCTYLQIHHT